MKKLKFVNFIIAALFLGFSFTSCEEDDTILSVDDDVLPEIIILEGENTATTTIYVSDLEAGATKAEVTVTFTSTDDKMKRLYMTQDIAGAGAEKYELDIEGLDKKGDGSIALTSNEEYSFTFKIPFPVLSGIEQGTVVYKLWTTSSDLLSGDYRDPEKRNVAGPGTIIINYGGSNPSTTAVKEYTAKLFAAPLADGSSETFISLADGQLYRIDQGSEYVAYWDFGYYYGGTNLASLASTYDYPSNIVDIVTIAGTTKEDLNHAYFALATLSVAEFDAISNSTELDYITQSSSETITDLAVDNVIEFVDNYGKKGLIKVTEIKGTYNAGDYIKLDIKVQP